MIKTIIILILSSLIFGISGKPSPPLVPELEAIFNHEKIILTWGNRSEDSIDSLSGYSDFEGYRIFRSTDGGITWGGEAYKLYDYNQNFVGWKPYAQFDIISELDSTHCIYSNTYEEEYSFDNKNDCEFYGHVWDGQYNTCTCAMRNLNVRGYDPIANWVNIGDNSGIKRRYEDTDVLDGVEYTYAITAYDMGMTSFDLYFQSTVRDTLHIYDAVSESADDITDAKEKCEGRSHLWDSSINKCLGYNNEDDCISVGHIWSGDDDYIDSDYQDKCFRDDDYCFGDDSYCSGQECCSSTYCCFVDISNEDENGFGQCSDVNYDTQNECLCGSGGAWSGGSCTSGSSTANSWTVGYFDGSHDSSADVLTKSECLDQLEDLLQSESSLGVDLGSIIWLPNAYSNEEDCLSASYTWMNVVDNSFSPYIDQEDCLDSNHEWVDGSYDSIVSCEQGGYDWKIVEFKVDTLWTLWNPDSILGFNYGTQDEPLWGIPSFESGKTFESFSDLNLNGICDYDAHSGSFEPFVDVDSTDSGELGVCDIVTDWTNRCPDDECRDLEGNIYSISDRELCIASGYLWGVSNCKNIAVVEPGYKSSNITFPEDNPEEEFIRARSSNRGNGDRFYSIVNEYDLKSYNLIFEIEADLDPTSYGDINGSYPTSSPKLYAYQIDEDSLALDVVAFDINDFGNLDSVSGLPGVIVDQSESQILIPNYKINGFDLLGIDNPQYEYNYTDWFDGIQFRFDNGANSFTNSFQLVQLKEITYNPYDSSNAFFNEDVINLRMRYKSETDLQKRLMYRYEIEFASSFVDTSTSISPLQSEGNCSSQPGFLSLLPFKIKNLETGKYVDVEHADRGIHDGIKKYGEATEGTCDPVCDVVNEECIDSKCVKKIGYKDCFWNQNELITLIDSVYMTEKPVGTDGSLQDGCSEIISGESTIYGCYEKVFQLKMDFSNIPYFLKFIENYFEIRQGSNIEWERGVQYDIFSVVQHGNMLFRPRLAEIDTLIDIDGDLVKDIIYPTLWYDIDDDGQNDNAWEALYPWDAGDKIIVEPYGWYQDGDIFTADLSLIGKTDDNVVDDLDNISVSPNPYIVNSGYYDESVSNKLRFTRLPKECTISIYTISGEFVNAIDHNDSFNGSEWWDLKNGQGEEIAPGLYIYVVQTPSGGKKIGKFAVVR